MSPFDSWFNEPGAYIIVDGQYGSTGKGLLAGYIAEHSEGKITHVTTNAGPNSGHTAYWDDERITTQQVPVASVFLERMGHKVDTLINAGAVIDTEILKREINAYLNYRRVFIHPTAAIISDGHKAADEAVRKAIAGTGKGIGPAIADKVMRTGMVAREFYWPMLRGDRPNQSWDSYWDWNSDVVLAETAQGYSLGLNSARFYPKVTSRECTVMQALADARIPAQMLKKVVASYRVYPIRVGNTEGSSGDCYPDQEETTWEALGLEPELTTVTRRVRRVFTWSDIQFRESIAANQPDVVFCNFLNYIESPGQAAAFLANMLAQYKSVMGRYPDATLTGYGPKSSDIRWFQ